MNIARFCCGCAAAVLLSAAFACSSNQLHSNTNDFVRTIPDLLQDQTLENYARIAKNHFAIPAFVTLVRGTSQLTDQFGGGLQAVLPGNVTETPSITGQRQSNVSCTLTPITDAATLEKLRIIYVYALGKGTEIASDDFISAFAPSPPSDNDGKPIVAPRNPSISRGTHSILAQLR